MREQMKKASRAEMQCAVANLKERGFNDFNLEQTEDGVTTIKLNSSLIIKSEPNESPTIYMEGYSVPYYTPTKEIFWIDYDAIEKETGIDLIKLMDSVK